MRKQEYFDMGIELGLSPTQIEGILCSILWISKEAFFKLSDIPSTHIYEAQKAFYNTKSWTPEAYTLQKAEFYSREFFVDERVLIPRNETEFLVDEALKSINLESKVDTTVYLDVGTGSSCIATSIIAEIHPLKFYKSFALDISRDALDVASKNISHHIEWKIELRESNLLEAVFHEDIFSWKNMFLTANLPYIKDGDYDNMWKDVVENEPDKALYGGPETWFELYEKLIKQCFQMKKIHNIENIDLFIEIGFDQYEVSCSYLEDLWLSFEYFPDNAKIKRVIHIWGF